MNTKKTIVLTGATRGLCRAMTDGFIKLGHTFVGCGRSEEHIARLRKQHGEPHDFAVVDVANEGQVRVWAERSLAKYGPPDLLLNNAALINTNAVLWEVPPRDFSAVIDANIKGTYHTIRHFVPAMVARKKGVIVNFSSGWGRSTDREVAPYCATKWAIEGLTRALAQELPTGMVAVPLNPGIIDTDMLRSSFGGDAAQYPDPDTWAKSAVPFLLQLGPKDNGKPLTAPGG